MRVKSSGLLGGADLWNEAQGVIPKGIVFAPFRSENG